MAREDLIQIRGGDAATWTSVDPILGLHEPGLETDTRKFKFGDGVTVWSGLAYAGSAGASQDLESVIAQDPIATSSPTFQGLVNIGNGAAATIFMLDGSSGCLISSNSGGLQLVHDTSMNLVTPTVLINAGTVIVSDLTGEPSGSDKVLNVVSLTQAEYDAGTPVATTIYNITDA